MAESFQRVIYPDFFNEMLNFDIDYNQTCNVVLTKNQTLIEIDRGWEGIPETLVINLILCSVRIPCHSLIHIIWPPIFHFLQLLIGSFILIRFLSSQQNLDRNK